MRKIILWSVLLVSSCANLRPAFAAVTASVEFDVRVKDGREQLWAEVRMTGIAEGESFAYEFRWTASTVSYTTQKGKRKGEQVRLFEDSVLAPSRPAGATTFGGCFCKDTGEKQCWRSRAWRNITTTLGDGTKVRGTGKWSVQIVRADTGVVIGAGSYTVE